MSNIYLEGLSVCVGYSDFLCETLPLNLPHFDNFIVITDFKDKATQEHCRRMSVRYYFTNLFYKDGDEFNKARGIDFGLSYLKSKDWICHLDADTVLPPLTRHWLTKIPLDEECIYGVDRVNCVGSAKWDSYLAKRHLQHDYMCRVHFPADLPILDRIAIKDYEGYLPIGYMQLWHGKHGRRYPLENGDAERTDVLHAMQWEAKNRRLIPELVAIHLQSNSGKLGENWKGRKSPPFRSEANKVINPKRLTP